MTEYYVYINKKAARKRKIDFNNFASRLDVINSDLEKEEYALFPVNTNNHHVLKKYNSDRRYIRIKVSGTDRNFPHVGENYLNIKAK